MTEIHQLYMKCMYKELLFSRGTGVFPLFTMTFIFAFYLLYNGFSYICIYIDFPRLPRTCRAACALFIYRELHVLFDRSPAFVKFRLPVGS